MKTAMREIKKTYLEIIKKAETATEKEIEKEEELREAYSAIVELERTNTVLEAMEINRQVQQHRVNTLVNKPAILELERTNAVLKAMEINRQVQQHRVNTLVNKLVAESCQF